MTAIEIVFWASIAAILYTLIGYPVLTLILALIVRKPVDRKYITPRVSYIIAAYNEEKDIAEKLEQSLQLDYPKEQFEIIVASDGSTDRTDEIVRSFADRGVKLYQGPGRQGKTGTLNGAVLTATGDIVIFSDATGVYNKESIRELVANFNDPTIGCVTGRVQYRYGQDATSAGFKGYQRIAVAIRQAETHFGSQTSVSGSIHAIRRLLYREANPGFSLDVIDAVHAVSQGYRVVYEKNAISLEDSRTRMRDEFRCRVRIGVRATAMIPYILFQLVRNGRFGYLFQMVSHKILRWWLWFLLLCAFLTNLLLLQSSPVYMVLGAMQCLFYALAIAGLCAARAKVSIPFLSTASFFLMGNCAMCVGAIKCLFGKRMPKWEPIR